MKYCKFWKNLNQTQIITNLKPVWVSPSCAANPVASDRLLEKHWFSISKHTTKSKSAQFLLEFNKFKIFRKQHYAVDSTSLDTDCGIVEVRAWREDCKSGSRSLTCATVTYICLVSLQNTLNSVLLSHRHSLWAIMRPFIYLGPLSCQSHSFLRTKPKCSFPPANKI